MRGKYIKTKPIQLSLSEAAYNSIKILAQREEKTVSNYLVTLVEREIVRNDLPLFCTVEIKE